MPPLEPWHHRRLPASARPRPSGPGRPDQPAKPGSTQPGQAPAVDAGTTAVERPSPGSIPGKLDPAPADPPEIATPPVPPFPAAPAAPPGPCHHRRRRRGSADRGPESVPPPPQASAGCQPAPKAPGVPDAGPHPSDRRSHRRKPTAVGTPPAADRDARVPAPRSGGAPKGQEGCRPAGPAE